MSNRQRWPLHIRRGITRTVLITRRYAIKVPSLRGGTSPGIRGRLQSLAWGLLANQSEHMWHDYEPWAGKVAPVLHSWLGGMVNVYPRCQPLDDGDSPGQYEVALPALDPSPGDIKPDNYGRLGCRIVRIDYDMR